MDDVPSRPLSLEPHDRPDPDHDVREPPLPLPEPPQPQSVPQRRSRLGGGVSLLLVLLIVAGLVAWVLWRSGHQATTSGRFQSAGPMPVGTAQVTKGDMPIILNQLGTVTPLSMVTVKTQINGQLTQVAFQEGQIVKKGDFLAQIDPRPYQVALEQAEGQLAKDQALLKNAQVDLVRYKTLVAQNSIAKQQLDTQVALVQQDIGTVQADQAQVDTQKLNLVYCHVVSPTEGRVGLRQVDAGNYVQTSDANGLVVITQLQPISVIFTVPEDNLPAIMRRLNSNATLTTTAYDRTGATKLETGKLQTVDNQIDTTTGTVKLRAVFDNPEQILFPNQFVNIQLLVNTLHDATLVPNAAVQRGAPGTFVYVVKDDSTVSAQPVTLGPSDSQNVAVTKGLQPGQKVVTDGADRLKDGAKVSLTKPGGDATGAQGQGAQDQSGQGKKGQKQGDQAPSGQMPAGQAPSGQAPGSQGQNDKAPAPAGQNPPAQAQGQNAQAQGQGDQPQGAKPDDGQNNTSGEHHRRRRSPE